ncbi:hypothetical protein D3C76_963790 [compost metagenome]
MRTPEDNKNPTLDPPVFTTPRNGDRYPTNKIPVQGTSYLRPPTKVWVLFNKGHWEPNTVFDVRDDGSWGGTLDWGYALEPGTNSIVARHEQGSEYSSDSEPVTFHIELPDITIGTPAEGAEVPPATGYSGRGTAGATVTVVMAENENEVVGRGDVFSGGDWSAGGQGDYVLPPGKVCVKARLTHNDGVSPWSEPRCFYVTIYPPQVMVPVRGAQVPSRTEISGRGFPGAIVEVKTVGASVISLGTVEVNDEKNWRLPVELAEGAYEIEAFQTNRGVTSPPSSKVGFTVRG